MPQGTVFWRGGWRPSCLPISVPLAALCPLPRALVLGGTPVTPQ